MALTAQQQNFISEVMRWAEDQLVLCARAEDLVDRYNLNAFSSDLVDGDVQAIFPHLTAQEVIDAVVAVQAVLTAIGDSATGQKINLIKMKG